ncbi:MAG: hypothetical protein FWE24_08460 [Defluviitaleaceae bacterium]|nr:hypothetical protein [Defluviitaleaceae bacterium]
MRNIGDLIQRHITNYPALELVDLIKLTYQNEFGPGHMVSYDKNVCERILIEIENCKQICRPNFMSEYIGNGLTRVHCVLFSRLFENKELAAKVLASIFAESASIHKGCFYSFADKLDILLNLIKHGHLRDDGEYKFKNWAYNYPKSRKEIDNYIADDYPAPSHSDDYRKYYHPCYRVVIREFLQYVDLFKLIEPSLAFGRKVILGIDGRSGAGKTTLAKIITNVYGGDFISMDDFYLPLEFRTPERMDIPGGHIHFERFIKQVLNPIKACHSSITYEKYDCQKGEFSTVTSNLNSQVVVIEGSYSNHPWIRDLYSHTVFLNISDQTQKKRLLKRGGRESYQILKSKWIPLENKYHKAYDTDKACNILF